MKRGRSKIQTKLRRKQRDVVDEQVEQVMKLREAQEQEKKEQSIEPAQPVPEPLFLHG